MPVAEVKYKDRNGFHYKHPERSCSKCEKYPCVNGMQILLSDFAKFGCKNFSDVDVFDIWSRKR